MSKQKAAFIHPDLGIGGAEQLVINLALALQEKDVETVIYTPHHDKNHCFKETIDGSLKVEVVGKWFPAQIFGKFTAFCAMVRMIIVAFYLVVLQRQYDILIVDQVTSCLPLIRLFFKKTIFYCHFPDKLLCVERKSIFKKVYRFFIDILEEFCLLFANSIVVNSGFTRQIYNENFKVLSRFKSQPDVLYPAIDFSKFAKVEKLSEQLQFDINKKFVISLNRYERKKNINLALYAFSKLKNREDVILIIAGGYEDRVQENKQHYTELVDLAKELKISEQVIFERNISNEKRTYYLSKAQAVLYTPTNEHFGIVPVEAMYNETPVIAINSGGPKESVKNNVTGYLLDETPENWAEKIQFLLKNPQENQKMGIQGKNRVIKLFGFETFRTQFYQLYQNLQGNKKKQ